jgi:hypothetical protein
VLFLLRYIGPGGTSTCQSSSSSSARTGFACFFLQTNTARTMAQPTTTTPPIAMVTIPPACSEASADSEDSPRVFGDSGSSIARCPGGPDARYSVE